MIRNWLEMHKKIQFFVIFFILCIFVPIETIKWLFYYICYNKEYANKITFSSFEMYTFLFVDHYSAAFNKNKKE